MRLSLNDFTFTLTEDCNFHCCYCFQTNRPRVLDSQSIQTALDFFKDDLQESCYITFYGGEPLLEFDTIRRTVDYIENHETLRTKKFRYSISINGALLTEEILTFLKTHKFRINLSHDGTAQNITRPSELNSTVLENLNSLSKLSDIEFETNSVFIPATAGEIFRSARFLIERGVRNAHLTHSIKDRWDALSMNRMREEVQVLRDYLLSYYRRSRTIPVENFRGRPHPGLFWCVAGQSRLALAADNRLWGCRFFADYFTDKESHPEYDDYCFGNIYDFVADHEDAYQATARNYRKLSSDNLSSEQQSCRQCRSFLYCSACPATAAFPTGSIGKTAAWICEIKDIWLQETKRFWQEIGKI